MNYLKENELIRYCYDEILKMYEKMSAVERKESAVRPAGDAVSGGHKPQNPSSTMEMWKIREQARCRQRKWVLHQVVMRFHQNLMTELNRNLTK